MGLGVLGFALVQMLALTVARGGGATRLRHALADFGEVSGATEAQLVAALGPPRQLRLPIAADDDGAAAAAPRADFVADWADAGSTG
ncbi:MAG: hypothetical protein ACRCUI_14190, partial [Polymorphobacter sp.]